MTSELIELFMIGERDIAVGTFGHPSAILTREHRRKSAAILKQNHLISRSQRLINGLQQLRREKPFHDFAAPQILHIHHLNLRQLNVLVTRCQPDEPIFPADGVVIALHRRRSCAQKRLRTILIGQDNGRTPRVIAWRRLLLFKARLVFFVDNHQAQPLKRQKHCAACTNHNVIGRGGKLFVPYLNPLGIAIFRMINAEALTKNSFQTVGDLHGQGDFGQEIKHLLSLLNRLLDEMDIQLRFAARCHTMQQRYVPRLKRFLDFVVGFLLRCVERMQRSRRRCRAVQSPHLLLIKGEKAAINQRFERGHAAMRHVQQLIARDGRDGRLRHGG